MDEDLKKVGKRDDKKLEAQVRELLTSLMI